MYRHQTEHVEFEHYRSNMWQYPTFLGIYRNLLSTDTRCLVIKLGGHCDMVDFALNNVVRSIGVSRFTCVIGYSYCLVHLAVKLTRGSVMAEGPRDVLVTIENRVPGLSCGIICVILRLAVFIQYRSVTDTHTLTHTNRRTDKHTMTACTALSIASCGKYQPYCTAHQV